MSRSTLAWTQGGGTMNSQLQTLMPNLDHLTSGQDGWRPKAPDTVSPIFHMLLLSPSAKTSPNSDMPRIDGARSANGNGSVEMALMEIGANFNASAAVEDEYEWVTQWVTLLGIWQMVVAISGTPLNMWVLYIWYRYGRSSSHNRFRTSRQINNHWFVASMTFADFLSTGLHSPALAAWYLFEVTFSAKFCQGLVAIAHVASTASSLSLLCLNLDKFLYMTFSLKYEIYVTKNRAIAANIAVWALSIGWALIFVTIFIDNVEDGCSYGEVETISYIIFSVAFFILPTLLSLIISIHIAAIVSRYIGTPKRSEAMLSQQHSNSQSRKRSTGTANSVGATHKCGALKRIAFIFTTTAWTAATCLPYRCVFMLRKIWIVDVFSPLRYIFYGVMSANAVGNPIITLFTLRLYRRCTVNLFHEWVMPKLGG